MLEETLEHRHRLDHRVETPLLSGLAGAGEGLWWQTLIYCARCDIIFPRRAFVDIREAGRGSEAVL
jgi:hypothetical protein